MLQGKYTGLRAIEESDLLQLLNWRNNPQFRNYFREYRELNFAQQLSWFNKTVNNDISTRMFSIVELGSARLLGACGLCYIDWVNRSADFSIYIGADELYIDSKFAPDAARTLIKYGYEELGLNRLWSEIYEFDAKKIRFFSEMNFSLDGRHRQAHWSSGTWHDTLFYSLIRQDLNR